LSSGRYTIRPGDTLGAIAAQHGVSVEDLIAANPGIDPQRLQIGVEIVIPTRR
ncbi:MAG: peptidoglycan-binding protein, partial [Chloroflexota bacterium]